MLRNSLIVEAWPTVIIILDQNTNKGCRSQTFEFKVGLGAEICKLVHMGLTQAAAMLTGHL